MNNISSVQKINDLTGQRVFLRGALNVPVEKGRITDDYRLQNLLPTINYLRDQKARIILAGHMSGNKENTFAPVARYLKKHFELSFIQDYANGEAIDQVNVMEDGEVILFENLRQYPGEKANDSNFSQMLADYADIYVNDAFPASHREHASIVGVPKLLPSYAGLQFVKEINHLSQALNPKHPFTFILGGAKFSTKLPLVEKFTKLADNVFVGGALANAYLKAAGHAVGSSRLPEEPYDLSSGLDSDSLQLPTDVVCQTENGEVTNHSVQEISADETVVDIGPESVEVMITAIKDSTMVVWNGPLGWYEKGFTDGTDKLAKAIANTDVTSILGGGDTAVVVLDDHSSDDFSFVSTAGGAMIDFLANETLPGIEALET